MSQRAKKILWLLLAAALLAGAGQVQKSLNQDRERLGLTRTAALQNAPPVLAFTTVALGGFRGLISNYLWIRANDLQLDDKFFEAAQLADWITDLEPRFTQVWLFQAWNMAYNISVKFKETAPGQFPDRWRWVRRGIELLRDNGLRYNPNDILMYQGLAWFFQQKMGQDIDDANRYYKRQWAEEMSGLFGPNGTNVAALTSPQTADDRARAQLLRDTYKMDPAIVKQVDAEYGPFDWRLPEAHAIYWAAVALQKAKEHPEKVQQKDLITVRRIIYQSMLQALHHGRIIIDPFNQAYALAPNLELIPRVNDAYEQSILADVANSNNIASAHRNFLKDAVYFLYEDNRLADAQKWYKYLSDKYPNKPLLDGQADSFPRNLSLDEFAVGRVQADVGDGGAGADRTRALIQGLLARSYYEWVIGQDDRYAGFQLLAGRIYQSYQAEANRLQSNVNRIGLQRFEDLDADVRKTLLDPRDGMPFAMRAVLRTRLRMEPETNAPPTLNATNEPASTELTRTNAPFSGEMK